MSDDFIWAEEVEERIAELEAKVFDWAYECGVTEGQKRELEAKLEYAVRQGEKYYQRAERAEAALAEKGTP